MSKELEALGNIKSSFAGSPIDLSRQFGIIEAGLKRLERLEEALKSEIVSEECLWNIARADGKGEKARRHRYCGEALARILRPLPKDPTEGEAGR